MRILAFFIFLFLFFACAESQPEAPKKAPLNPNGDSELALLMRDMYDDGMRIKEQIQNGEKPEVSVAFKKIHSAQATEPEKAASDIYHSFALAYEQSVTQLQEAAADAAEPHYRNMVDACMNCHKALCPGPTMRIKHLEL
ncbi:MAG: hypothetical protein GYB31_11950 [Bacteroidetes bacterium]|nr:hypothetical protein [Bacteroidota bacterium]